MARSALALQTSWTLIGIFRPYGTEFYYVELIAPQEIRLAWNATENRMPNCAEQI
jgi:hypothetical protein